MSNHHRHTIVDQFSKQAVYFVELPGHAEATALFLDTAGVGPGDRVLDVACGAGAVAIAAAGIASDVVGIDLTPTMIENARGQRAQSSRTNLAWAVGDMARLPFTSGAFD